MSISDNLKKLFINNKVVYSSATFGLEFCHQMHRIQYFNMVSPSLHGFEKLNLHDISDVLGLDVCIWVLPEEDLSNAMLEEIICDYSFSQSETILLPGMRLIFENKHQSITVISANFFTLREIYYILPYAYFKMNLFKMQPIILHACSVRGSNDAYFVFIGESGAGKTTTAKLANQHGLSVLSDELVCIFWDDTSNVYRITGTAVTSSSSNITLNYLNEGPISSFILLKKEQSFRISRFTARGKEQLISRGIENSVLTNDMLLSVHTIARQIPFYTMGFTKDYINWKALEKTGAR